MDAMFGSQLVAKEGGTVETASAFGDSVELIGLYFSAHWCPPCRGFTPQLAKFYNDVNANGKRLEIVFVTHDRDESSFKGYFNEMPWLAIPFDSEKKEKLIETHQISGIPTLIFLSKDGEVKFKDGRGKVSQDGSVEKFPFNS